NIPAGTPHSYRMQSHRTRLVSYTKKGNVAHMYSVIGNPYAHVEHPPHESEEVSNERFAEAAVEADIAFLDEEKPAGAAKLE
ncbi:quercetin 2,3-dioxygenase, partial [Bacillus vallismortis]|nr:quercetin 2,3-dioxygenase [Bacillus vallismortis]